MDEKYIIGQHVFIISNNSYVMEMVILRISGDFFTLRSVNQGSGMRLKRHRIYATKEEAQKILEQFLADLTVQRAESIEKEEREAKCRSAPRL